MKASALAPVNSYEFIVAVDSASPLMSGRLYHRSLVEALVFNDIPSFALDVEDILDSIDGMGAETLWPNGMSASRVEAGKVATFRLEVPYRQNNSWQGKIAWLEQGTENQFRSFLDLVLMMSEALSEETE